MIAEHSNYDAIIANILATYAGIDGIDEALDYEPYPTYPKDKVVAFTAFDELDLGDNAQGEMRPTWSQQFRISIPFNRKGGPEILVRALLPRILHAHHKNLSAGGTIPGGGVVVIKRALGHYVTRNNDRFRILDVQHVIDEQFAFNYEA